MSSKLKETKTDTHESLIKRFKVDESLNFVQFWLVENPVDPMCRFDAQKKIKK